MNSRVGIVGAGLMGRTIALRGVQYGLNVRLFDAVPAACSSALHWIDERRGNATGPLACAESLEDLHDCEVLIEAVVENRSVKRRLLMKLSDVAPSAFMATNTSSLSVTELAESVAAPERFCGLHFCHPVAECPLVEVVATPATSGETLGHADSFIRGMQLTPLRTRDVPGFAVNRLLFPYLESAIALVRNGIDWRRIETCATAFGMRLGPLSQMDEIGIDVILRAAAAFHRGNPVVPPQSELLLALYQAGRKGRKTGRGFFDYGVPNSHLVPDAEAVRLAAAHQTTPLACTDLELTLRLFVPMVASACDLVEHQVVADVSDLRSAMVGGLACRHQAADLPTWAAELGPANLAVWQDRLHLPRFDPAILW